MGSYATTDAALRVAPVDFSVTIARNGFPHITRDGASTSVTEKFQVSEAVGVKVIGLC